MEQPQFWSDTNWTLLISIIAGSAVLAYAGDVLGFKYGKQRISIFGLRPRHTSHLITAFTGMFISVVVLAILSFFSESVRASLFKMESLQQDLNRVSLSLDMTRFDMEALRQERDILSNERDNLDAMVSSLRDEAEELHRSLDVMRLGAITVQANSLLAQQVVFPGTDNEAAGEIITALEGRAREEVAAKRSEKLYTVSDDVVLIIAPEEKAAAEERASGSEERLYLRVLAAENTALNEVVTARLESGVSYLLYDSGETIHRKLVRPDISGFMAEEALHGFLRELKNRAINNGVKPDPATYSVGALEGEDFFDIVEALRSMAAPTIINAVALEDIYTEGPVRIKILLE